MLDPEIDFARSIIDCEAKALTDLALRLDHRFTAAVDLLVACADAGGTVQVTGLGKSGHVGAKISATLASLGIPSHSIHPTEAVHGDLGRFRVTDSVIAISFSGETEEVVDLCALLKQDGIPIVAITNGSAKPDKQVSSLERLSSVTLTLGIESEAAAPDFVAPSTSTTATLALGDALALAAARRRNFTPKDFARRHPGGALGGLLRPVTDVLRSIAGKNLPCLRDDLSVADAMHEAAKLGRRPGAVLLVDPKSGVLTGIFTDGDLRRLVLRDTEELKRPIGEVMTRAPRSLSSDSLVRDAVRLVREFRQDEIPVIAPDGKPVGILDVQDLIAMRLVQD